jgi:(1->4)-alpha-D-glucan 1-alpha-D-glucosylmutase
VTAASALDADLSAVPTSTYRLQLHQGFRFADAEALVPYLAALGVGACYSSPHLMARPGSTHGYDICDHSRLNPEVGDEEEYAAFVAALRRHQLGHIVDFVPNHMGIDASANPWWRDVLENGPSSPFAAYFDIDWHPVKEELEQKLLLPILGDQYGRVLERGELQVHFSDGAFVLRYFEHDLPLNPRKTTQILEHGLDALRRDLGDEDAHLLELLSVITALRNLPAYTATSPGSIAERQREKEVTRDRLARLATAAPAIRAHVESAVGAVNGTPGDAASFDALHQVLDSQAYRLAYWRTASHEINYRRFFDINQLAGLRMEDECVFEDTHRLLLRLVADGLVDGIRLDHIDGLIDPEAYLAVLRQRAEAARGAGAGPFYLLVEKILSGEETLPESWPVAGTSGYDFLNDLNGLFIDRRQQRVLLRVYRRFTGRRESFADIGYAAKKLIMDLPMSSELNVLAHALNRLSERDRRTRDFTLNSLRDALQEVAACFPIYRTYVSSRGFTDAERAALDAAIDGARRRNATAEPSIFDFVRAVLLPEPEQSASAEDHAQRLHFAMRFQQYTGPLQAKGLEDTAFYRYNVLASLNEVGGDPARFGRTPAEFHAANAARRRNWPFAMLATSTHDTKRGEDGRARLDVLSEIPEEWGRHLSLWARLNASHRAVVGGEPAPARDDEYLFYQTLLAAWPQDTDEADAALVERVREYMVKAAREAKLRTSWISENRAYEAALVRFVDRVLAAPAGARFRAAFAPFRRRVARLGMLNSLSQLVLKIASPGVPDFYQGTELWDLSLVDPDNRRPVDFARRRSTLAVLEPLLTAGAPPAERSRGWRDLLERWPDGGIKLALTAAALRWRRRRADLFLRGDYLPLEAHGRRAENVVAFARLHGESAIVAIAPRLVTSLSADGAPPLGRDAWEDTAIALPGGVPSGPYRCVLSGQTVASALELGEILHSLPVALLETASDRLP